MKILFFGSGNCHYSRRAYDYLRKRQKDITAAWSQHRKDHEIPEELMKWQGDLIVSYRTAFIVPRELLKRAKIAAINFHPATPEYPGSGSYSWALYEGADHFGSTVHEMTERIDAGAILMTSEWPISERATVQGLFEQAQTSLFELFQEFISDLFEKGPAFIDQKRQENAEKTWRGPARAIRELDLLMQIPPDATPEEMARRIRATHFGEFRPYITVNGYQFELRA
jgi:methionyl-tRNA formyltransferase